MNTLDKLIKQTQEDDRQIKDLYNMIQYWEQKNRASKSFIAYGAS